MNRFSRIFIALLVILLVVAAIVIYHDHTTIASLRAQANITAQRDLIREHCTSSDPVEHAKCADDLQTLSDMLSAFSKTLPPAPATSK
ncbi:MAG: hypothetical protein ACM3TU_02030 [Bacillota bacterium]